MIEGQEDVTWDDWRALAGACEEHGVGTMFRSDHYLSVDDRRERGSLDAWGTICALGAVTETLRLGTMVSPATFRHPSVLAKLAVTADHVSGGRVEVGIGAGWWEREHELYGFDLPPVGPRMEALEEQMQIVRGHFGEGPFSFAGEHFSVSELDARPKPVQQPLPLILGAKGGPRSLRFGARYADEYNTVMATAEEIADLRRRLDEACEKEGRDPATLPLSMMTGWLVGADRAELVDRAARLVGVERRRRRRRGLHLRAAREHDPRHRRRGDRAAARAGGGGADADHGPAPAAPRPRRGGADGAGDRPGAALAGLGGAVDRPQPDVDQDVEDAVAVERGLLAERGSRTAPARSSAPGRSPSRGPAGRRGRRRGSARTRSPR